MLYRRVHCIENHIKMMPEFLFIIVTWLCHYSFISETNNNYAPADINLVWGGRYLFLFFLVFFSFLFNKEHVNIFRKVSYSSTTGTTAVLLHTGCTNTRQLYQCLSRELLLCFTSYRLHKHQTALPVSVQGTMTLFCFIQVAQTPDSFTSVCPGNYGSVLLHTGCTNTRQLYQCLSYCKVHVWITCIDFKQETKRCGHHLFTDAQLLDDKETCYAVLSIVSSCLQRHYEQSLNAVKFVQTHKSRKK